jgi:hypothetical protein
VSYRLSRYADLYRQPGPWCLAYVDASTGMVDGLEAADVQPEKVRNALAGQGASPDDLDCGLVHDGAIDLPAPARLTQSKPVGEAHGATGVQG